MSAYCVFYGPEYQSVFPVDKPLGFNSSSDISHCICQTTSQRSITRVELEGYIFINRVEFFRFCPNFYSFYGGSRYRGGNELTPLKSDCGRIFARFSDLFCNQFAHTMGLAEWEGEVKQVIVPLDLVWKSLWFVLSPPPPSLLKYHLVCINQLGEKSWNPFTFFVLVSRTSCFYSGYRPIHTG